MGFFECLTWPFRIADSGAAPMSSIYALKIGLTNFVWNPTKTPIEPLENTYCGCERYNQTTYYND
jgi:hypothetical protein